MSDRLLKESDVLKAIDKRIEELSKHPEFVRKNGNIDVMGVKKHILAIPSAETPQWIPCSERLPKKYEQVLCCNKDGRVFSTALTYVHPEYKYWYFGKHRSVIAWMPLPKPWKGADDE